MTKDGRDIQRKLKARDIRCAKPCDVAHVVELGLAGEPAHVHVFDHALAQ